MRTTIFIKIVGCLFALSLLTSCLGRDMRTPEQWFQMSWSGMAGWDALTFDGSLALLRGEQPTIEQNISYKGQLDQHHKLSIQTTHVQVKSKGKGQQALGVKSPEVYQSRLLWRDGGWRMQATDSGTLNLDLNRLNPLSQLEQVRKSSKNIREESGAARGTKVLRIELDPADAKEQLKQQLISEMQELKTNWEMKISSMDPKSAKQAKMQLDAIWTSGNAQMIQMLENANTHAVYHLTINQKSGLPIRLTSETIIDYSSPLGLPQHEVLLTDNRFTNYK